MVPQFVCQHIGLSKLTGSAKALPQFVVESKVDIDLLVLRTIKRPCGGLRPAATRRREIAIQHQLRVPVGNSTLLKNPSPGLLHVIEHERHELDGGLLGRVALRVSFRINPVLRLIRRGALAAAEQGKEIALENQTQNQNKNSPANAEMNSPESKTTAASAIAAFVAAIFNVLAIAARCPTHRSLPSPRIPRLYK